MKKVFLTILVAVFAVLTSHAEEISGKWKVSVEGPQGTMEMTYTFKVDGEKLTGSISTPMGDIEISNGKVNGNEFSFDMDMMGTAVPNKGTLDGEVIKLKMEMPGGGPEGPGEMTLTKVKE